jgi:enoyl-CoA hydratase/carnithine racemase
MLRVFVLGGDMDISAAADLRFASDLVARSRDLEARTQRLIRREIGFASHCREQAVIIRQSAARCRFPEIRERMLMVAVRHERLALSAERFYSSFRPCAEDYRNLEGFPANGLYLLQQNVEINYDADERHDN